MARSMSVNLLAANYHEPSQGALGSGIYGPNGPISYTADPASGTTLIIGQVVKNDGDPTPSVEEYRFPTLFDYPIEVRRGFAPNLKS